MLRKNLHVQILYSCLPNTRCSFHIMEARGALFQQLFLHEVDEVRRLYVIEPMLPRFTKNFTLDCLWRWHGCYSLCKPLWCARWWQPVSFNVLLHFKGVTLVPYNIHSQFKVLVLTDKVLNGLGPGCLKECLFHPVHLIWQESPFSMFCWSVTFGGGAEREEGLLPCSPSREFHAPGCLPCSLTAIHCSIKTELVRQANTHLVLGGFMAATVLKAECFCFIVFQNYFIILLWFYMLWAALGKTLLAVKDDLSGPSNSVSWRHRFNPHRVMHKVCFDIPTSG